MSNSNIRPQQKWARLRWPDWIQNQPLVRSSLHLCGRHAWAWLSLFTAVVALSQLFYVTSPVLLSWMSPRLSPAHQPELRIYLNSEVQSEYGKKVTELLGKLPVVANIQYLSSDQALRELKDEMGEAVAAGIEDNFLPASIAVHLRPVPVASEADRKSAEAFTQAFAGRVRRLPGVETVDVINRGQNSVVSNEMRLLCTVSLAGYGVLLAVIIALLVYVARTTRPDRSLLADLGARRTQIFAPPLACFAVVGVGALSSNPLLQHGLAPAYHQLRGSTLLSMGGSFAVQTLLCATLAGVFTVLLKRKIA